MLLAKEDFNKRDKSLLSGLIITIPPKGTEVKRFLVEEV
jgi:hypothetical protein